MSSPTRPADNPDEAPRPGTDDVSVIAGGEQPSSGLPPTTQMPSTASEGSENTQNSSASDVEYQPPAHHEHDKVQEGADTGSAAIADPGPQPGPTLDLSAPQVKSEVTASLEQEHGVPVQGSAEQLLKQTAELSLNGEAASQDAVEKERVKSPSPPPPPPKDEKYLNAITPTQSQFPAQDVDGTKSEDERDMEYAEKYGVEETNGNAAVDDSQSEIQSIMEQFDSDMGGPGMDEIMSPRLEIAHPHFGSHDQHPPRRSSLEPLSQESPVEAGLPAQPPPPRTSSLSAASGKAPASDAPAASPSPAQLMFKAPPPQPDPEPDLPFDFHRFLEQLRHRTADPVAKFLRSFLTEFGKKQWMVHEQVKIISDFLEFITKKMAQCEVWRTVSDTEFDNAREGMEKLVMNRLYTQTFSPAIPPPQPLPDGKGRRKGGQALGPGRRGQHQEDVERDEVLAQKIRIYKWVREEHLDIKPLGERGNKFILLAQQELLKIKSYRAPRDKVICILNCCKVIFGFLRSAQADQSADSFVPLLIYTVLQANPEHLVSNVQYILRFRNQEKLAGEAGYYISSLMGAVQFIENLDRTSLTISDEEYEKHVEAAVSEIAERHSAEEQEQSRLQKQRERLEPGPSDHRRRQPSPHMPVVSEKSSISRPEVTPRNSLDAERAAPRRSAGAGSGSDDGEENAAVAGLLRTIQRPLTTIGRMFSDPDTVAGGGYNGPSSGPALTPRPGSAPRPSAEPRRQSSERARRVRQMSEEDAAARQASAEAEEARRIQRQEHAVVVETLAGMFPQLDRDIIDDVVRMKEGRVGLAVDACLALSNPE